MRRSPRKNNMGFQKPDWFSSDCSVTFAEVHFCRVPPNVWEKWYLLVFTSLFSVQTLLHDTLTNVN